MKPQSNLRFFFGVMFSLAITIFAGLCALALLVHEYGWRAE